MLLDQRESSCGCRSACRAPGRRSSECASASRSSLSHSMTVRSAIAAFSIGTSSDERPAGDHEAADMLRQVARKADQLARRDRAPGADCGRRGSSPASRTRSSAIALVRPAPDDAGERGDDIARQAERLADLADRAARAIADHGRGEAGAVAAVFLVDVLDDLLAPLMLEIDVDVGRLAARGADEALEQHVDAGRVDRGDAEAVADDRIGRRAAALAQDAAGCARSGRCRARSGNSARNRAARSARARARSGADARERLDPPASFGTDERGWDATSIPSSWARPLSQGERVGREPLGGAFPGSAQALLRVMPSGTGSSGYS